MYFTLTMLTMMMVSLGGRGSKSVLARPLSHVARLVLLSYLNQAHREGDGDGDDGDDDDGGDDDDECGEGCGGDGVYSDGDGLGCKVRQAVV